MQPYSLSKYYFYEKIEKAIFALFCGCRFSGRQDGF